MNSTRDTANPSSNVPSNTPSSAARAGGSEASGQFEGLRHPIADDQRVEQRLDDVGLEDQGDVLEDELRDRNSSGTPAAGAGEDSAGDVQRH